MKLFDFEERRIHLGRLILLLASESSFGLCFGVEFGHYKEDSQVYVSLSLGLATFEIAFYYKDYRRYLG